MELLEKIKAAAKQNRKRIVLPEAEEERTLRAADQCISEGLADIILIGNKEVILKNAKEYGMENIGRATIVEPLNNPKKEAYVELMLELRKSKGLTREQAEKLIIDPLYLGVMMIKAGDADGEVAGANNATGDVLRPAFQYVKTKPGISVVSGAFLMILQDKHFGENGLMVFADCAVHPNPTAPELAQIAVETGRTARIIAGIEPRIAMLSFSTKGSADHEILNKVKEAAAMMKEKIESEKLDILADGELQADAALVPGVAAAKAPGSPLAGGANILVFPDLNAGNIGYKLVQRLAKADAYGPILQGLAKPLNDLSRGCVADDIFGQIVITVCQAAN